jgi:glycosyltransferase involved in cell wall biosynthesis
MRLACICVTEGRAPLVRLAVASFYNQTGLQDIEKATLYILIREPEEFDKYAKAVRAEQAQWSPGRKFEIQLLRHSLRPRQLVASFATAFDMARGNDLFLFWDDDDIQPCYRLWATVNAFKQNPDSLAIGYPDGWFFNLRTFEYAYLNRRKDDAVWGSSITFATSVLDTLNFETLPDVGFDTVLWNWAAGKRRYIEDSAVAPVAGIHTKNVASFLHEPTGEGLSVIQHNLRRPVEEIQAWMIANRIYPSGSKV